MMTVHSVAAGSSRPLDGVRFRLRRQRHRVTAAAKSDATSSDLLEQSLYRIFKGHNVDRVVESIKRNLTNQPQFRFEHPGKGIQEAHAYIEGLTATNWHDVNDPRFSWMKTLEKEVATIQNELALYRAPEAEKNLMQKGSRIWSAAAQEEAIAYGPNWRTLVLQDRSRRDYRGIVLATRIPPPELRPPQLCKWSDSNIPLFPKTTQIVKDAAVPSVEVFFARQAPGSGIKEHSDGCNFILTSHLGLDVPEGRCFMTVGGEKRPWANGKGMIFDTSFLHETFNEGDVDRYVLLIRFWHPELTLAERVALQYVFDCVDDGGKEALKAAEKAAEKRLAAGAAVAVKQKKGFGSKAR